MSVIACSFVTFLSLDVLLCIWMLHRVPLHIHVSSKSRQWLQLLCTQRVLQAWTTRHPAAAKTEAAVLRQAISDTDWDTVERHDGLEGALKNINQPEQETPALNGQGMIDDFRLWGSSRCRRMGETGTKQRCSPSRFRISTPTTPFSQRTEFSPLWSETFTKRRTGRGTTRICRVGCETAIRGFASRAPLPPGVTARRTGGKMVVRATPGF